MTTNYYKQPSPHAKTSQEPMEIQIRKRQRGWIGRSLKKPADKFTIQILVWEDFDIYGGEESNVGTWRDIWLSREHCSKQSPQEKCV